MSIIIGILEEGLIYAILALGVYITYKILDFPDLSVDGTFPLGAAVTAMLILKQTCRFSARKQFLIILCCSSCSRKH